MVPTLAKLPPAGPEWLHEVKFDGFRAQVHTEGGTVTIYSRRGADMTRRFRRLKEAVASIPADSAIIDCELVACDESGQPDFRALMNRSFEDCDLCLWCFDLLALDGERMTGSPLSDRRQRLKQLLNEADEQGLVFSQDFGGPDKRPWASRASPRSDAIASIAPCMPVLLSEEHDLETWLRGTPAEAFALARSFDARSMRIVQSGFEKKDLLAA